MYISVSDPMDSSQDCKNNENSGVWASYL